MIVKMNMTHGIEESYRLVYLFSAFVLFPFSLIQLFFRSTGLTSIRFFFNVA